MALTSLSSRVQILPTTSPAVVRPSKRVVQVTAKQDMPHRLVSRSGMAAAAAAILLTVRSLLLSHHGMQTVLRVRFSLQTSLGIMWLLN